jgi:hypothetical protein
LLKTESSDISEYQIQQLFDVLPSAWKKAIGSRVNALFIDDLILLDSKLWTFNGEIVGFSCWDVGPLVIIHTLEYQSETMICKNTINAQARIGFKKEFAELFSRALDFAFSNDFTV